MSNLTRRRFLRQAALTVSAASLGPLVRPAPARSANAKLNLAIIGVGGRGHANMTAMAGEQIVALCDVDRNHLEAAGRLFPQARKYADFRELLDQERDLDAAVVSTPDHTHAPASVMAMKRGLHVYCEKPLTHSVYEARVMAEVAAQKKVITQMGTGAQSSEPHIRAVEMIQAGAIGEVVEAHCWTDRPIWPQGQARPQGEDAVPAHLSWDLWIGPAPMRPFKGTYAEGPLKGKQVYHPFVWRGWWDFGTGALGDIAPHITNVVFWALNLGAPTSVEAECSEMKPEAFPSWSTIRFAFPARGDQPPVTLYWYDGGKRPPAELVEGESLPDNGTLFVGRKGRLLVDGLRLYPKKDFADYKPPEPSLPRRAGIHTDWLRAIKEGGQTGCHFGYAGPMTEAYLLGNIALKVGRRIEWDPIGLTIPNCPEATPYVKREYRQGWTL